MRDQVTPLILTFNEAPNIRRTLEALDWAREILVIDSFSTDGTVDIVRLFPNARLVQRAFDDHTAQWNFGIDHVTSDWVLSLDADYILTPAFVTEVSQLPLASTDLSAWFANIEYCIAGRQLRSSLYPPRAVLFRKSSCRYIHDGHTQLLKIDGKVGKLRSTILHDDRKPFTRWLSSQSSYVSLEAQKLLKSHDSELNWIDRLRKKTLLAPPLMAFYALFVKGLIFDGWPGVFYAMQRVYAELLLSLELLDQHLNGKEERQ